MSNKNKRELQKAQQELELVKKLTDDQKYILQLFINSNETKELGEVCNFTKALAFLKKKAIIKEGNQVDNIKLGVMGSWFELFGCCEWYIPEFDIWIKGTCGEFCSGCFNIDNPKKSPCYCVKSYIRKTNRNEDGSVGDIIMNKCTVKLGHFYRTVAMLYFKEYLIDWLDDQLQRINKKLEKELGVVTESERYKVRINEAGELVSVDDLKFWCELANRRPEIKFYLYTKNFAAVEECVSDDCIPSNIFINMSIWHEYGVKEYLKLKWHPQVRCYAYVDAEFTVAKYKTLGLNITRMCPAYDSKGIMNHNITCDKCGNSHCCSHKNKETGCFDHS